MIYLRAAAWVASSKLKLAMAESILDSEESARENSPRKYCDGRVDCHSQGPSSDYLNMCQEQLLFEYLQYSADRLQTPIAFPDLIIRMKCGATREIIAKCT